MDVAAARKISSNRPFLKSGMCKSQLQLSTSSVLNYKLQNHSPQGFHLKAVFDLLRDAGDDANFTRWESFLAALVLRQ